MTATTIRVQMAQRKDTAANWTAANPILLSGEIGYETDTKKFKIGDGTTNWNSLAYLPIPDGSGNLTITGNLEIGSTGSLTFEGSTADGFETTLAVTDPTADRTITLPDVSGTVVTTGDTGSVTSTMIADGTIVDADVSATAEIAVSKLANGTANQVIVTDGTNVSWSDDLTLAGNLTVNGTTTTVNTQTLVVEDKNIELGVVGTPTDLTADGGGITLKGTTDKTINWVDSTDAWTSSEHIELASSKSYRINGAEVLSSTTLGSGVTGSSLTSVGTISSGTWQGTAIDAAYLDSTVVTTGDTGTVTSTMIADGTIVDGDINASAAIAGTKISPDFGSQNAVTTGTSTAASFIPSSSTIPTNGVYLPAANSVGISANSVGRVQVTSTGTVNIVGAGTLGTSQAVSFNGSAPVNSLVIDSSGRAGLGTSVPDGPLHVFRASAGTVTANGNADELVVENSSAGGISILTPDANHGYIIFGSPSDNEGAILRYRFDDKIYTIGTEVAGGSIQLRSGNGTTALTVDSSQRVGVGTTSPGATLDVAPDANRNLQVQGKGGTTYGLEIKNGTANSGGEFHVTAASSGGVVFNRGTTEMGRFDSNSRLLVGTSTGSGNAKIQLEGGTIYGDAYLDLCFKGTVASGQTLGELRFTDAAASANVYAKISANADATPGASDYPGRLVFSTTADGASSPTERMRISNNGTTNIFSSDNGLNVRVSASAGTATALHYGLYGAASTTTGTISYVVWSNGNVQNTNNSYGAYSDIKLKENIVDATSQWSDIKALQVRKYNFKEGQTHTQIGLIAQEVELVSPGLVTESPDRDAEGNDLGTVTKSVNYSVLYMKAVKALQEAMERIETLEAKVAALESA